MSAGTLKIKNLRGEVIFAGKKDDLSGADLRDADLSGADLSCADLRGASIACAELTTPICRIDFGGWSVCVRETTTTIGCKTHGNGRWLSWGPDAPEIAEMDPHATQWWKRYGATVKAATRAVAGLDVPQKGEAISPHAQNKPSNTGRRGPSRTGPRKAAGPVAYVGNR